MAETWGQQIAQRHQEGDFQIRRWMQLIQESDTAYYRCPDVVALALIMSFGDPEYLQSHPDVTEIRSMVIATVPFDGQMK